MGYRDYEPPADEIKDMREILGPDLSPEEIAMLSATNHNAESLGRSEVMARKITSSLHRRKFQLS